MIRHPLNLPGEIRLTHFAGLNLNLNLNLNLSLILILILNLSLTACTKTDTAITEDAVYQKADYGTLIPYQTADPELKARFNREIQADSVRIEKGDTSWTGYVTENRRFLEEVITPALEPYLEELSRLSYPEMINELTLFTFNIFQEYFGTSFYRWGGDLYDLDDPQVRGGTIHKRYGLDCSGFVMAPFDLAVHFGLIPDSLAVFSSKGFQWYCDKTGFEDGGGLDGGPNNYRVDTREMIQLGEEVFRVEKGESPTAEDLQKIQPGDVAGRSGHFGILVFIDDEPYYLESGGRVVPSVGGRPVKAGVALTLFARNRYVSVRRGINNMDNRR